MATKRTQIAASQLRDGGVDNGGTFVEYTFERRRESGWVARVSDDIITVQTFSGDYMVMHHVRLSSIRRVYSAAELAAIESAL